LEQEELKANIKTLLDQFRQSLVDKNLTKKIVVFDCRFMTDEPETFEAIANKEEIDITRQRVQQIDADLKKELKFFLRKVV
jgi:DNA-directed RNA polymerase sigma subunit (sigma70/sigma32)